MIVRVRKSRLRAGEWLARLVNPDDVAPLTTSIFVGRYASQADALRAGLMALRFTSVHLPWNERR